ncbi:MAG: PH domain-containing protein [Alphaproteobacteria bacterium]|nr:PH domain-containing protein [Alphaproteobacteria bacterium]
MLYVQQSLAPDEELVHIGKFHWMYTVGAFMAIFWGLVGSILVIVAAVYAYMYMGFIHQDVTVLESVRILHPAIRAFSFLVFVFGLLRFAGMMIVKATTEIAVTTNRLIYKRGLVARQVGEINIDRIEGVNVFQSILGRIFNFGRVMVRGMGVGEVLLPTIDDPIAFRRAIEKAKSL